MNLYKGIEEAFRQGWNLVKLYFMVGLPTETDDDIDANARLAHNVSDLKKGINMVLSGRLISMCAPFVPKGAYPLSVAPDDNSAADKEIRNRLFDRIRRKKHSHNFTIQT